MVSTVSPKGSSFIGLHEGTVLKRYLDPVGIPTIGRGFTLRNPIVKEYFGGKLPKGTKMTLKEVDALQKKILDADVAPSVELKMPGANQCEFDAGASITYNVGPRVLNWNWAKAWRAGNKDKAATLMRTTATTAQGKKLAGLVRRRKEEALLLSNCIYTGVKDAPATPEGQPDAAPIVDKNASLQPAIAASSTPTAEPDQLLREYQGKLKDLGYDPGDIDGWMGPATKTAVLAFQKDDPELDNDGIFGRATRESIDRHLENKKTKKTISWTGVSGVVGTLATWVSDPNFVTYVAVGIGAVVVVYLLWRKRDLIEHKVGEFLA